MRTLFPEKNEGGSGGFNRLMRYFIENTQHKWLLLFDDDAYPAFTMRALCEHLSGEIGGHAPAYTFKVTYPDGTICAMNRPGMNILNTNPLKLLFRDHHVEVGDATGMVDFASFAGILLKREWSPTRRKTVGLAEGARAICWTAWCTPRTRRNQEHSAAEFWSAGRAAQTPSSGKSGFPGMGR